jgi:hypothetical protein
MGRQKKITLEIFSYIETLSCFDSGLTNFEIINLVSSRWPAIKLSESTIISERIKLGFTWHGIPRTNDSGLISMQRPDGLAFIGV